jgi:holin-like protein
VSPLLTGLTWLLVFQCIGEVLVRATGAPVPGPVVGMVLLFALLRWRGGRGEPAGLAVAADGLLKHLSLLFVPAGVGVMLHASRLADEWLAIAVALVASTVAAIAATALTMRALMPRAAQAPAPGDAAVEGGAPGAKGDGADRPPREPR